MKDKQIRFVAIGTAVVLAIGCGVLAYRWLTSTAAPEAEFVANAVTEGSTTQPIAPPVPVPKTLTEILTAHKTPLPEISAWATAWTSAHQASGPVDAAARTASETTPGLADLIDKSDLTAMDCLHFGEVVRKGGDSTSAKVWEKAGVLRAEKELLKLRPNDFSSDPLLAALGRANTNMWSYIPESAPLIEIIANLGIRFDRNAPWDQRKEWSRVALAAAVNYQGRDKEAMALTQGMLDDLDKPGSKWTGQQRGELHSFAYRMFTSQGKTEEGLKQLALAGQMKGWPAHNGAIMQLFSIYLRLNRPDDAQRVLNAYIKENGDDENAAAMRSNVAARATTQEAMKEAQ